MNTVLSAPSVLVQPGRVFVSRQPIWIRTGLGSCVAVCLCDRTAGVGGMNHIMLPGEGYEKDPMLPARYGIHAMELLINAIHQLGGDRRRLEAAAFGGADVLATLHQSISVGQANIAFVREFLKVEKIPLTSSLLGGAKAMRVCMLSTTNEVNVELIGNGCIQRIVDTEARLLSSVSRRGRSGARGQVTLF